MTSFYTDSTAFSHWGIEHLLVLSFLVLFGVYFIRQGTLVWDFPTRKRNVILLCLIMVFFQMLKLAVKLGLGTYNQANDLPLHICPLMPFAMIFVYMKGSRDWWAIFFFWIMAGSSQALFTTTLKDVLPHYEALRYWTVHGGIVIAALYGFFAYGWRLEYKDVILSGLAMNAAALLIYPVNIMLESNYFYLNAKPPGTTLYTFLPEWPWYILCLEGVLIILFSFVFFLFKLIAHLIQNVELNLKYDTRN